MCVHACMCVCVCIIYGVFKPIDLLYQVVYNVYISHKYICIIYLKFMYMDVLPTDMHNMCVPGGCGGQKRNHCI